MDLLLKMCIYFTTCHLSFCITMGVIYLALQLPNMNEPWFIDFREICYNATLFGLLGIVFCLVDYLLKFIY